MTIEAISNQTIPLQPVALDIDYEHDFEATKNKGTFPFCAFRVFRGETQPSPPRSKLRPSQREGSMVNPAKNAV